ncbi:MAG: sulfotransferase, partial [Thermoplasmata archaeon]|nr:sulfotransferase [Thermoplasmata archaeon]
KYFKEKELIPEGNLVEVRYEDFVSNPFKEIKRIYEELGLKNFERAKHDFIRFMEEQKKIKVHQYVIGKEDKEKIYNYWKLTIDKWGYDV